MRDKNKSSKNIKSYDTGFHTDASESIIHSVPISAHFILLFAALFVVAFIIWANFARLDEVTRGDAKVIPSKNLQIVQNLEGGIVNKIFVAEGDIVEKGEVLMEIDRTRFASSLRENEVNIHALQIRMLRLSAQAQDKQFEVPSSLIKVDKKRVESEKSLYLSKKNELDARVNIYRKQRQQKRQELNEIKNKRDKLEKSLSFAQRELDISKPLLEDGAVSEVEIIHLERQVNDLQGELDNANLTIPRLNTAISEFNSKIEELKVTFRTDSLNDFNNTRNELTKLQEEMVAVKDRVDRTQVRAPLKGTVNQIKHKTIGAIVQGGETLAEIVPLEDSLLFEVKIRPQDIGFLRPEQDVTVKLTAYDYSIYGGLPGKIENISADVLLGQNGEQFYKIIVRTSGNSLEYQGNSLEVIPGMSASVDILTGNKTVMDYILKPLLKTKQNALRER